jgi:hypothetical protein
MKRFDIALTGAAVAIAALLAGCGGQSPPVAAAQSQAASSLGLARSWIAPEAKKGALLYVSGGNSSSSVVEMFTYPKGKAAGELTDLSYPSGMCVDKAQDVFVTQLDGPRDIVEYAHGGTTPIATLSDPEEFPIGCSIDPTTGNLAVANELGTYGAGSISIYAGAKGSAEGPYSDSAFHEIWFCGYDDQGNLFIDGVNSSDQFEFAEMPEGSSSFTNISLNQRFHWPGGIQWDGKYVAVGDREGGVIYQTNGAGGQIVGTTTMRGVGIVSQYFIDGKTVIAPNNATAMFYHYPKGGKPFRTLDAPTDPFGAVVSDAVK